jgi:hypothetical protein
VIVVAGAAWIPPVAQAAEPQVEATWTTNVTATSANLHARVNPGGLATTLRFEYIEDTAYRTNLAAGRDGFSAAARFPLSGELALGAGAGPVEDLAQIAAFKASTTYEYRALATNGEGAVPGPTHILTTEETAPVFSLLDARGWELVSPLEKNGGAIQPAGDNRGGGVLQAAAQGGAITYSSTSSFGAGAQGTPAASQYVSRQGPGGWSIENITTPLVSGSYGDPPDGVPYQLFSTDLNRALLLNGEHCRVSGQECPVANPPLPGSGAPAGFQNYYLRDDEDGAFQALLTDADTDGLLSAPQSFDLAFAGAGPDLEHVVLSTCSALTPDATEQPTCESGGPNLYEWSGGALRLINRLGADPLGTSDAHLAAQSGAISADGSRVYFTVGEDAFLYLREGEAGARLVAEHGSFQTASADGSLAFYTEGEELLRYRAATATSELIATGVVGVLGASADGSRVYYATGSGVFLWDGGLTTAVASGPADSSDYPPTTGTARVSPDGTHLAFLSAAALTGYDTTDQGTGLPDTEVYLYAAAPSGGPGTLTCVSCNPTGERPQGPSSIPGASPNGTAAGATDAYKPRDLSSDGRRVFFDSADALVLQDTDNQPDAYEWEAGGAGSCQKPGGCVELLSDGRSGEGSSFVDASADGADAFFLTDASLIPSDPGSVDLYDAREDGGFPIPETPTTCEGDACQSLPPEPEDPTPGTLVPGPANPAPNFPKTDKKKPKKHHKKKHQGKKHAKRQHRGKRRSGQ